MKKPCGLGRGVWLVGVALLPLAGCATDGTLEQAQRLANQGRWEESLKLLEQARGGEGSQVPVQAALVGTRSMAVQDLLGRADAARQQRNWSGAQADYERVLRLEPGNARAKGGLQAIVDEQRRSKALDSAEGHARRGSLDEAERVLRPVLVEAPKNERALALTERIDEQRLKRPGLGLPELELDAHTPISMEFRDADLKKVFDAFSRASGVSFVFDRDIRADAKVTVRLKNSSLKDAIDSLLLTNQLDKKVLNANTLFVFPATAQKQKDHQELVIRNFYLAHADAKQVMSLLKTIVKAKDVYVDEKRNTLVLRDTPEAVALAEKLVAAHDQPDPEVMLVVEVMEIKRTRLSDIGLGFPSQIKFSVGGGTAPVTIESIRGLPSSAVNISGLDPLLAINLKKVLSEANLLANPRIRVRNREKARIHVGDRVPYSTTTTSATTSLVTQNVTYLDVGLKLEVEPQVFLDDDVTIRVALEVSSVVKDVPLGNGQTVPQVGTRNASTTLSLKNGETQVLAGLIRDDEKLGTSRLPGLGDIPVIGRLFSSENAEAEKTEILLSITPHILRNLERPGAALTEYLSGPDGQLRSTVVAPPAADATPMKLGAGGTAQTTAPIVPPAPGTTTGMTSTSLPATSAGSASGAAATAVTATSPAGSAGVAEFEAPPGFSASGGGPVR